MGQKDARKICLEVFPGGLKGERRRSGDGPEYQVWKDQMGVRTERQGVPDARDAGSQTEVYQPEVFHTEGAGTVDAA